MVGPIVLYLLVVAGCALAALPLCRLAFGVERRLPLISLGLTVGAPLALLLFSLVARVLPAYTTAVPVMLLLMGAMWAGGRTLVRRAASSTAGDPAWDWRADLLLLGAYAALLALLVYLRAGWPSIFWEHDYAHVGSEKLFNFSLIQAFLFGHGYPPENLWLAGEPVDYYLLLHALPGLVAWGWRVLTGDPAAADVLFVFSDAALLLFGSLALSAWSVALLSAGSERLSRRFSLGMGLGLGIGVLLSVHAKAVGMVLAALLGGPEPGWWALEREAVPYTYSQYPFFLLLQGDHQAFQRVFFLQIALCGAVVLLLSATRLHWPRILLVGALAAAVQLTHSGSVLLDLVVFGLAATGLLGWRLWHRDGQLARALVANLAATAAVALVVSLPALWRHGSPSIRWYWVETGIASPLLAFLSAQAGPLVFFVVACGAGLWTRARADGTPALDRRWTWTLLAVAATLIAVGRQGAAVAASCALLVLMLAPRRSAAGEDRVPLVFLAAAVFGAWLLPEFVVGDFSHRPVVEWKRWNLAMRFWLEGHYLVPFLAVVAFAPAIARALADRRYSRALAAVCAVVGTLWLVTHAYALVDRKTLTPDVPGLDATAFLERDHRCDAAIVDFLRQSPGRVQVGELCGTAEFIKPIPLDYGWAGRIAAFSGRPGVCGWSRHVWQFTATLRHGPAAGTRTRDWFRQYEFHMMSAYLAAQRRSHAVGARDFLDRAGVTHVVLGEPEHRLFPWLTGASLAAALDGRVAFESGTGCAVVRLEPATGR